MDVQNKTEQKGREELKIKSHCMRYTKKYSPHLDTYRVCLSCVLVHLPIRCDPLLEEGV